MSKRKKLILIDSNAILHRAFHALPPLTSPDGVLVNAVYGFITIFLKMLKDVKPDYVAASFDVAGPTFRHEQFEAYKAQRVKQPQELYDQIPLIKEFLQGFGVPVFEAQGFEADDIIGTIVGKVHDADIVIMTGDLDLLQLVDDRVSVYTMKKGMSETAMYDAAAVRARYGLGPSQIIELKALKGDPSDNIAGVKGIGEKTAIELLQKFSSLEGIYKEVAKCRKGDACDLKGALLKKLDEGEKDAFESRDLVTIRTDVPIEFSLEACAGPVNRNALGELFRSLGFMSLLDRIPKDDDAPKERASDHEYRLINSEDSFTEVLAELSKQKRVCVDTETTSLDERKAKLLGIAFSWEEHKAVYVQMQQGWLEKLRLILEDPRIEKIGHNIKYDFKVLKVHGIEMQGISFDTMIASYLLNPGSRQHNLDQLVFRELGHEMISIEELTGEKKKEKIQMALVPPDKVAEYAGEDADYTLRLANKLRPKLEEEKLDGLFRDLEMPLIRVLSDMELTGIKVDVDFLKGLSDSAASKLTALEKKIYELAEGEFNINSPQQLKVVLFEKLQISTKGLGKTKTGISTAAEELDKLMGLHPIIEHIVEYRELTKLQSTYLEALPKLVDPDTGRVYTSFNQTVAATGRLSSSDPNLQNIPVRTELGREVRKAFVADRSKILLSADYSQMELRIAAHLANDESMIAAFRAGEDIHARTAAELNGISIDKVTKEQRYAAKAANFGILYGMGANALAQLAGWSRDEARAYLDKYFEIHVGIKEYVEQTKALARELGYVETIFGRRRYLPEITAEHPGIRAAAERMAINMPIQGSEADMVKKAMIVIYAGLPKVCAEAAMLLQVHDSLIVEVPLDDVDRVATFVSEEMESVVKLKVPVVADVSVGKNWGDLKPL
ncbi:MAG: DNA polymerase I [bacterium]|nr:DNA polymerase I [bacterium]